MLLIIDIKHQLDKGYGLIDKSVLQDKKLDILSKVVYSYLCATEEGGNKNSFLLDEISSDLNIESEKIFLSLNKLKKHEILHLDTNPNVTLNVNNKVTNINIKEEVLNTYLKKISEITNIPLIRLQMKVKIHELKIYNLSSVMKEIEKSKFLQNKLQNYPVKIDYFIMPEFIDKILTGYYRDRRTPNEKSQVTTTKEERIARRMKL